MQKASVELALPGPSLNYYRAQYQYQRYFPLTSSYTVMLNGEAGFGEGYGGKPLPFFRNFFAGGVILAIGLRSLMSSLGFALPSFDIILAPRTIIAACSRSAARSSRSTVGRWTSDPHASGRCWPCC